MILRYSFSIPSLPPPPDESSSSSSPPSSLPWAQALQQRILTIHSNPVNISTLKCADLTIPCHSLTLFGQDLEDFKFLISLPQRHLILHQNKIITSFQLPPTVEEEGEGEEGRGQVEGLFKKSPPSISIENFDLLQTTAGFSSSSYRHLHIIRFYKCPHLVDVSGLGGHHPIHSIQIRDCDSLSNLTGLGNVYDLLIAHCPNVRNLTPLTNNYRLFFAYCCHPSSSSSAGGVIGYGTVLSNVVDLTTDMIILYEQALGLNRVKKCSLLRYQDQIIPMKPSMKSLSIQMGKNIPFGWFLRTSHSNHPRHHLFSIELMKMKNISDLSPLADIPIIHLNEIMDLSDISCLGSIRNKSISIISCQKIVDFSSLKSVPKVCLKKCDGFSNGYDVENVQILSIQDCNNLKNIDMLGKVHHLTLHMTSNNPSSLAALKDVIILDLNLKDAVAISFPGKNEKIICLENFQWDAVLKNNYILVEKNWSTNSFTYLKNIVV